jgi:hypothetical protein
MENLQRSLGLFVAINAFHHFCRGSGVNAAHCGPGTFPVGGTNVMTFGPRRKGREALNLARRCFLRRTGTLHPFRNYLSNASLSPHTPGAHSRPR